jgi:hypothetical protein
VLVQVNPTVEVVLGGGRIARRHGTGEISTDKREVHASITRGPITTPTTHLYSNICSTLPV